jgi:hypothetical protein
VLYRGVASARRRNAELGGGCLKVRRECTVSPQPGLPDKRTCNQFQGHRNEPLLQPSGDRRSMTPNPSFEAQQTRHTDGPWAVFCTFNWTEHLTRRSPRSATETTHTSCMHAGLSANQKVSKAPPHGDSARHVWPLRNPATKKSGVPRAAAPIVEHVRALRANRSTALLLGRGSHPERICHTLTSPSPRSCRSTMDAS